MTPAKLSAARMTMASIAAPPQWQLFPYCHWTWARVGGRYRLYLMALTLDPQWDLRPCGIDKVEGCGE